MFCLCWEMITTILWIIIIFYIPYRVNFESYELGNPGVFQILILIYIIVESVIKLNEVTLSIFINKMSNCKN